MGKKKPEEMATHRVLFRDGAAKKGIDAGIADEVFDLMQKFAGYGFNKSHAAAYSLLAYQTAWIKQHHPAEFFAANLTIELDNSDKLKVLIADAKTFGVAVALPDVNTGTYRFEPVSPRAVRYGLGCGEGHRAGCDRIACGGARVGRPVHEPVRFLCPRRPRPDQSPCRRGAGQGGRLRRLASGPRLAAGERRSGAGLGRHAGRPMPTRAASSISAAATPTPMAPAPPSRRWWPPSSGA